ncbi:MAG: DNA polymerase III subunit alpha [Cyclobacteriaceae bacterium]|nr:DNA polymerase III subunit alpha [Cyclobacteriaceae bacterium]
MFFNCHTYFSFKYGTLSVADLFNEAKRCGVRKLVLTDINSTAAYIELLRICRERRKEYALEVAIGIEFRRDNELLYIGLAVNNEGFEELNKYLSHHNNEDLPLRAWAPEFSNVYIVYPWQKWGSRPWQELRENEYVGVRHAQLNRLHTAPEVVLNKMVAWQPVTFSGKQCFNVHRLLRAVANNTLLSKLPAHEQAQPDEMMWGREEMRGHFQRYPELVTNADQLVEKCGVDFTLGTDKNKRTLTGSLGADLALLRAKAWEGFCMRYDPDNEVLLERFERELSIIFARKFVSYYLIAREIINHARSKGYPYIGRGSGANSMVAYCLGITNVDPMELDLYFERFLNPERSSPPDFDMDFSWKDRDKVIRFIFERFGHDHVSLLGTHTTYKRKSILRELGKVFGLPKREIDDLVDYPEARRNKDNITRLIFRYAERMYDMPANLSIHAGGVLITERPIYAYTATDLPPKGFPVAHFEMHNAEDMGVYKFDVLSQRGLGHIEEAVRIVKKNRGVEENIERFKDFKKDPKIQALLRRGKTMGCFYVESPAMRGLLGKLKCDDYITLVAASSIIRPGVARSGMMRTYIERHNIVKQGGSYEAIHPLMDELMRETYGVMVYQEDVIKVAHHFAGLSLSEADILRRGMSGKFRSRKEFQRVEERFFANCRARGYPEAVINRVWFEIESFSGYSFSKGHSASYAVESYQSLYLKAHYPLEFMVGVINNFGGFYHTEFYFHEARMSGADIQAPCVNRSGHLTTLFGKEIYIGFIHLRSLETKLGGAIPEERERHGPFRSLDDFVRRMPVHLEQLRILIRVGAFRFTGKSKPRLLWEAMLYFGERKRGTTYLPDLFNAEPSACPFPELERKKHEDAFDELEIIGFPLCDPFELVATSNYGNAVAGDLKGRMHQQIEMVGYLITIKYTGTKDGKLMYFGTFYDREGNVFDTVHFPNTAKVHPFRGRGFYRLRGKVVEDFGVPSLEVNYMDKLPMVSRTGNVMGLEEVVVS